MRGYRYGGRVTLIAVVSLSTLEKNFASGDKVSPNVLLEKGLIDKMKNKTPQVKILANGDITKKLTIEDCAVSASAIEKIKKAGGKVA